MSRHQRKVRTISKMKMTSKIETTSKIKMTSKLELQFGGRDIFYDLVDLNEKKTAGVILGCTLWLMKKVDVLI